MESWTDDAITLGARRHGENSALLEVLSRSHGRHFGLLRGGFTPRAAPVIQTGAQIRVEWRARLHGQLGLFRAEPVRSRADAILSERGATEAAAAIAAMLSAFLPEREPALALYEATGALYDHLATDPEWPLLYAQWEMGLLAELGFRLDLSRCAVTGGMQELIWVSPKTGRAVCRAAGAPWADKLLPLPGYLRGVDGGTASDGLRLTGHFLEKWALPSLSKKSLPDARIRLMETLMLKDRD